MHCKRLTSVYGVAFVLAMNVIFCACSDDNDSVSSSKQDDAECSDKYDIPSKADLNVSIRPSSYQSPCDEWQDCHAFIMSVTNNDVVPLDDMELRLHLNSSTSAESYWSSVFNRNGSIVGPLLVSFEAPVSGGLGFYLPIRLKGTLEAGSRVVFQVILGKPYELIEDSWSLKKHTAPEPFDGVDLTKGPLYTEAEGELLYNSEEDVLVNNPYIEVFSHCKHIYGYGPGSVN